MKNSSQSQPTRIPGRKPPFPLSRYFTFTSLAAFVIVAVLLVLFYRQAAVDDLMRMAEAKNAAITQTFSNSIWPEFAPFLRSAASLSPEEIRQHPETARLRLAVHDQMQGLTVVKVKIYNLQGLTIFSTEDSQIGEDNSTNAGFLAVLGGGQASELTHRDTFSAFDSEIVDRDLISSYLPIRRGDSVEGVFEVYDDVTPLLNEIAVAQRNIAVGVTLSLSLLYLALFLLVRKADATIKRQYTAQLQAEEKIQTAYHDLELEKRREARTNEFFRSTVHHMIDSLNHGAPRSELLSYLEQVRREFSASE